MFLVAVKISRSHKHLLMPLLQSAWHKTASRSPTVDYILSASKGQDAGHPASTDQGSDRLRQCDKYLHTKSRRASGEKKNLICQQNKKGKGKAEPARAMSQSQAVRKRMLQHIWRKSEGMTQSASE